MVAIVMMLKAVVVMVEHSLMTIGGDCYYPHYCLVVVVVAVLMSSLLLHVCSNMLQSRFQRNNMVTRNNDDLDEPFVFSLLRLCLIAMWLMRLLAFFVVMMNRYRWWWLGLGDGSCWGLTFHAALIVGSMARVDDAEEYLSHAANKFRRRVIDSKNLAHTITLKQACVQGFFGEIMPAATPCLFFSHVCC